jgi:hypothetical protein
MRAAILASVFAIACGSAAIAMPVAPQPAATQAIQVHGCHRVYQQDVTGWHRHDRNCQTLRGVVGRKSRTPGKS